MEFYNKWFYQLTRLVDPDGMLNVPFNVFTDEKCLDKYFRTNNDFRKLDVARMCDQLIILLTNFDELFTIASTIQFLQNDFQRLKYPFIMISKAAIGLVTIYKNSVKAYWSYCNRSTMTLYKNRMIVNKVPRKRKRKRQDASNQTHQNIQEINQNQQIELHQSQVIVPETNQNEIDIFLSHSRQIENVTAMNLPEIIVTNMSIHQNQNTIIYSNNDGISRRSDIEQIIIQPIEMFPVSNQNLLGENPPLPENVLDNLMNIDVIQPTNLELQLSKEQPQNGLNVQEVNQIIEHPENAINIQEQHNQLSTVNNSSQKNLPNQPPKKKRNFKKRPIEQSSKILKKRLKKLEGELHDRPLELIAMNLVQKSMNHLPLRYNMYHNKVNIPFAALTLNMELEQNKNQDDIFNNEMTMNMFKAITEKSNNRHMSNSCIYQQCINNSLPHLSLLPLAEEYLTNNSIVWRNTINEINKRLSDSLKDISSFSKINQSKWEEFKEKIKHKMNHSLVVHKTLIGSELSRIDIPQPDIVFPSANELLSGNSIIEQHNSPEVPQIITENICQMTSTTPIITDIGLPESLPSDKLQQSVTNHDNLERVQNGSAEPIEVCRRQTIDAMQLISDILKQSPEKTGLLFTDLCPIHVTNRKNAILVLGKLLELHKNRIIKLSQPYSITEPSSISIKLNMNYFFV